MVEALVFLLLILIFSIVLPVWTYIDAEENSDHPAVLWALLVFFAGIIGLILYLILGRNN